MPFGLWLTKVANDVAVVVAKRFGGNEAEFADMRRESHALGMNRTIYRNASGLPDEAQEIDGKRSGPDWPAIQERFPRQYAISPRRPSPTAVRDAQSQPAAGQVRHRRH